MGQTLLLPFTESEMLEAVKSIDAASCPGEDGLPRSFFLTYWDILATPLRQGLQEIFDTRVMLWASISYSERRRHIATLSTASYYPPSDNL